MDKSKTNEPLKNTPQAAQPNEGEGNKSAARHYNDSTAAYVKSGKVEKAADAAEKALDGPEGDKLRKAEEEGKKRAANRK